MLCLLCGCSNTPPVQPGQSETVTQTVQETQETASAEQPAQTSIQEDDSDRTYSDSLMMSAESGFYDAPFDLEITAPKGCKIYYTTDGSAPDSTKTEYKKPITLLNRSVTDNYLSSIKGINPGGDYIPQKNVKKANVIRAAAVNESGDVVETMSRTFFVGVESYGIPVISIMTDPKNLFDKETGIYVMGKTFDEWEAEQTGEWQGWQAHGNFSNRGRDWERPASIELLTAEGVELSQDCGIRIAGNVSRTSSQKSFRFIARDDYGKKNFKFQLIPGNMRSDGSGELDKYREFVIRNGGNDCDNAKIRDPVIQKLASLGDYETLQTTPVVAYLDGEYWGMYTLTEYYSSHYIENNYSVEKGDVFDDDNIIFLKKGEIEDGNDEDIELYNEMYDFVVNNDMSDPDNYMKLTEMLDIESYADYIALNLYIGNQDAYYHGNNWAMWRVRQTDDRYEKADGRWRMMVYDTEFSTGVYDGGQSFSDNMIKEVLNMEVPEDQERPPLLFLRSLMESDRFMGKLVNSLCDMRNICFEKNRAVDEVLAAYEVYQNYVPDTWVRFGPEYIIWMDPEEFFRNQANGLANYFDRRYSIFPGLVKDTLELGEMSKLNISYDDTKGTVYVNNKPVPADFSGTYFADIPVRVKIVPMDGFKENPVWEGSYGQTMVDYDPGDTERKYPVYQFSTGEETTLTITFE